jgi:hypothetical protein
MIRSIIDDINRGLDYSFRDVLKGIVYPVWAKTQYIPGSRDGHVYKDAVPDASRKSIVYWEDWGTTNLLNTPRYNRYQTAVRLVVWFNFDRLESTYDDCVREMLNAIPKRTGNEVFIMRNGQMNKGVEIFSRYNYPEGKQYVAPPYDVAAFHFNIRYMSTYCPPKPQFVADESGILLVDENNNNIIL